MGEYPICEKLRGEKATHGHPMDTEHSLHKYASSLTDRVLNATINTNKYRAVLRSIAVKYFAAYKIKENAPAGEQPPSEDEAVRTYLSHLAKAQEDHWEMCVLVINRDMKSIHRGETARSAKQKPPFKLQKQRVWIHGNLLQLAEDDRLKHRKEEHIRWFFLFNCYLHELCHVFVSFLSIHYMGDHRCLTPPDCVPSWKPVTERGGESGDFAEEQLWGGVLTKEDDKSNRKFALMPGIPRISSSKEQGIAAAKIIALHEKQGDYDDKDLDFEPILIDDGKQRFEANADLWYRDWKTLFPSEPPYSVYSQDVLDEDRRFVREESASSTEAIGGAQGTQHPAQTDRRHPRRHVAIQPRSTKATPSTIRQAQHPRQILPGSKKGTVEKSGTSHGSLKVQIPQNAAQLSKSVTQQSATPQSTSTTRSPAYRSVFIPRMSAQHNPLTQTTTLKQSVLSQTAVDRSGKVSGRLPHAQPGATEVSMANVASVRPSTDLATHSANSITAANNTSAIPAKSDNLGRQSFPTGVSIQQASQEQLTVQVQSHVRKTKQRRPVQTVGLQTNQLLDSKQHIRAHRQQQRQRQKPPQPVAANLNPLYLESYSNNSETDPLLFSSATRPTLAPLSQTGNIAQNRPISSTNRKGTRHGNSTT